MKRQRVKATKAFAIVRGDEVMLDCIEPFTDDGRAELLGKINRPAGQRVITIRITEIDH